MSNKIILKKVNVILGGKKVLDNITLEVKQNSPMCVIGMGSSGKSILLKSILGLVDLFDGDILVNDVSIREKKYRFIIDKFGVVFQKDALFDSLPVWQNIMFKSLEKKSKEENLEKASFLISKVGLSKDDAFLFPSELSGGMKKRVALARAVSHDPTFLLLDDPTAGLDPIKTNVIFNLIMKLCEELKITLMAITSDMKGAMNFFNEAVVLKESKLHWLGTISAIKKKPTDHIKDLLQRS